ncbi:MAG TPA: SufD family Fe-S cluster assembly protein, partial [Geminicoccaceae bacterium]
MLKGHLPAPEGLAALFAARAPDLAGHQSDAVRRFRQTSFDRFVSAGVPGARVEAWKYTPLANVLPKSFATKQAVPELGPRALEYLSALGPCARMVFVDGRYDPASSDVASAGNRVRVRRLGALLDNDPDPVLEWLGRGSDERSLDALNAALTDDGCVVDVGPGDGPAVLQIVSVVTGSGDAARLQSYRHLIRIAAGAEAHLVELDVALSRQPDVVNRVTRVELAEGARLVQERAQIGSGLAQIISLLDADLSADSRLTHSVASLGGALLRNEVRADLLGSNIEATFNGLTLAGTGQHVDHALTIRHAAPSSMSDQFYKGVLDGHAKSAFAGRIVVERAAQKTNAYQSNKTLLLSPDAEANAKPELEIYADDVKCSHGATAGELD